MKIRESVFSGVTRVSRAIVKARAVKRDNRETLDVKKLDSIESAGKL